MTNIEMIIDSIRASLMSSQRVVVLKEKEGNHYLPVWIGPAEADAIAVKMQNIKVPCPLAHDFVCATIDALGGSLEAVVIHKLENDTYYAKVIVRANVGQKEIDCRPSDALAVAVRKGIPIFTDEKVLKKAGVLLDEETKPSELPSEGMSIEQNADKKRLDIFSEAVRDILATSEVEAKRLNHGYVCTGHLLMALTKETNTASKVMKNAGVDLDKIQLDMETLITKENAIEGGGAGLTSTVKEAIQISIAEARRLGSEKVLPEHILLGLVRASDGIAGNHLKDLGVTPEIVYAELIRLYVGICHQA